MTLTDQGNFYASTVYSLATDNPAFKIAQGTCGGVAVAVGASCQLEVTFSPTAVQAYSGNATIVTYVSGTAQVAQTIVLPLSGTGAGPVVATPVILPGTGSYTSSQQVTITDTTPSATIYYTIDGSSPTANSTKYTGAITINTNETLKAIAAAAGYTQSAITAASFTFHEAVAMVTPTSLVFGNQIQGLASVAQTVTLKNSGMGTLTLAGFSIAGSAEFSQTNNCGSSLTAESSCTLSIVFTPASLGAKTATLTVNSDSIQTAPAITLTGTGISPPAPTFTPPTLAFGNQVVNSSSTTLNTTLSNPGTDVLVLDGTQPIIIGAGAAAVTASSNCPSTLAPAGTCTLSVTFIPSSLGNHSLSAELKAHYSSAPSFEFTPTVALTGTGIVQPAVLAVSPAIVDFGKHIANTTSAPMAVSVTNISATDAIVLGTFTIYSPGFSVNFSSCPQPLAPGASCTVYYTFTPTTFQIYNSVASIQPEPYQCGGCVRNYPPAIFHLTGIGAAQPPALTVSPTFLNFGNQPVNTLSAQQSVTITNASATDTVALSIFEIHGLGFEVDFDSCPGALAPRASCTVAYNFLPSEYKAYAVTASIQAVPIECPSGCASSFHLPEACELFSEFLSRNKLVLFEASWLYRFAWLL